MREGDVVRAGTPSDASLRRHETLHPCLTFAGHPCGRWRVSLGNESLDLNVWIEEYGLLYELANTQSQNNWSYVNFLRCDCEWVPLNAAGEATL